MLVGKLASGWGTATWYWCTTLQERIYAQRMANIGYLSFGPQLKRITAKFTLEGWMVVGFY